MSDIGLVGVGGARDLVADEEIVAACILTAACGAALNDILDLSGDRLALRLRGRGLLPSDLCDQTRHRTSLRLIHDSFVCHFRGEPKPAAISVSEDAALRRRVR